MNGMKNLRLHGRICLSNHGYGSSELCGWCRVKTLTQGELRNEDTNCREGEGCVEGRGGVLEIENFGVPTNIFRLDTGLVSWS